MELASESLKDLASQRQSKTPKRRRERSRKESLRKGQLEGFLALKPPMFKGSGNLEEAKFLIYYKEKVSERIEVTFTQKCC